MILGLQEIILDNLSKSEAAKRVEGIYYQVPSNSKFPYIYIGDFHSKDISTKTKERREINFKVSLYLRDKSQKFIIEMSESIRQSLKIKGLFIKCLEEKMSLHSDGITRQITMIFKMVVNDDL
jgi:hypothetical protein